MQKKNQADLSQHVDIASTTQTWEIRRIKWNRKQQTSSETTEAAAWTRTLEKRCISRKKAGIYSSFVPTIAHLNKVMLILNNNSRMKHAGMWFIEINPAWKTSACFLTLPYFPLWSRAIKSFQVRHQVITFSSPYSLCFGSIIHGLPAFLSMPWTAAIE